MLRAISLIASLLCCSVIYGQENQCIQGRYGDLALFDSLEIEILNNVEFGIAPHFINNQDVSLQMDIYYPSFNDDNLVQRPLIVLTHGGAFMAGNKSEMASQCMEYARRGFVAATISYRIGWSCDPNSGILVCALCSQFQDNLRKAIYSAVQDHRAAMRFLVHNATEYGIDTNWIFVGGESAGSIATMSSVFWNQDEASNFAPGALEILGTLDESGNSLTDAYFVQAIVNHCGAIFSLNDMDAEDAIPVISFHDENDCVVPYNEGNVIGCLGCTAFPYAQGSALIYNQLSSIGVCAELNTVPLSLGHCTWPWLNLVKRASCFLKRTMCGVCTSSTNSSTNATSPCSALGIEAMVVGCTYQQALNYNPQAEDDDGSCLFPNANCPSDLNDDGVVTVEDLLIFLSQFGMVCN